MTEKPSTFTQRLDIAERLSAEELVVDLEGFEGPLDLLLTLSRTQKVDLLKISVLELAQQYLAFIEKAKEVRIELAADYLVMAAWLAYLKSRLLLPPDATDEGLSAEELAATLPSIGTASGNAKCRRATHGAGSKGATFLSGACLKNTKWCAA